MKDFKKDKFFEKKQEPKASPKPSPKTQSIESSGSLSSDFKNATKLLKHIKNLDDDGKKAFADKYKIKYNETSEIGSAARTKFWGK